MKRYGMPYKGSKNRIAEKIVDFLPGGEVLVDLFGGGGAISHCAAESGKWEKVIYNEISPLIAKGFEKAVGGGFAEENRWISREDFAKLKTTDLYVAICWSFGNNLEDYLYSKEIEPWKKALHFARVHGDFSLLREFGIESDGSRQDIVRNKDEYKAKYIKWYMKNVMKSEEEYRIEKAQLEQNIKEKSEELRKYLIEARDKARLRSSDVDRHLGTNGMAGHYYGRSQWEFPTQEAYEKMQEIMPTLKPFTEVYGLMSLWQSLQRLQSLQSLQSLESLQRLESLQSLERLQRLQSLQSLERLESLEIYNEDYRKVKIPDGAVVYCDIPYKGTSGYGSFDYEAFYAWAEKQKNIYISEYSMPESRFECVAETNVRSLYSSNSRAKKQERIFVPKR